MNIIIYEKTNKKDPYKKLNKIYSDRIKKYCKLVIKNIEKEAPGQKDKKSYFINITTGTEIKSISSTDFAEKLEKITVNGFSNIEFAIDCQDNTHDEQISLTNLQTSYEMSYVMLLEQIYRCFKINNNEVYHK